MEKGPVGWLSRKLRSQVQDWDYWDTPLCGLNDYWLLSPPVKDSYSGTALIHEAASLQGLLGSLCSVSPVWSSHCYCFKAHLISPLGSIPLEHYLLYIVEIISYSQTPNTNPFLHSTLYHSIIFLLCSYNSHVQTMRNTFPITHHLLLLNCLIYLCLYRNQIHRLVLSQETSSLIHLLYICIFFVLLLLIPLFF